MTELIAGDTAEPIEPGLSAAGRALDMLDNGAVVVWAIAVLSLVTLALILWKVWRLSRNGAWHTTRAGEAVDAWSRGDLTLAAEIAANGRGGAEHEGQLTLRVTITRDGRLLETEIARSSGHDAFHAAALDAARAVGRYPSAPAELASQQFTFVIPIAFRLR